MMAKRRQVETLLGEWLEAKRIMRRQTRNEAAQEMAMTDSNLTLLVTRRHLPRKRTCVTVARYLGVEPEVIEVLAKLPADPSGGRRSGYMTDVRVRGELSRLGQLIESKRLHEQWALGDLAAELGVSHEALAGTRRVYRPRNRQRVLAKVAAWLGLDDETAVALAGERAAEARPAWPVETWMGVKRTPTVTCQSCERCEFRPWCMRDVLEGNYAWCEDVTAADYEATSAGATTHGYDGEYARSH